MASTTTTAARTQSFSEAADFPRILSAFAWAALLIMVAYFVLREVPRYFVWSEASYGAYYWPRKTVVFPHILMAISSIFIGPFQFLPQIRNGYPKVHRILGRIYVVSAFLGSASGMVMAVISSRGFVNDTGLFGLGFAGLLTTSMAYIAIRKRNFIQHKQWMVRSYVVIFGFVTIRSITTIMLYYGFNNPDDRFGVATWACWAVPLLFAEVAIQGKQVFADGTRSGT
jgi:uncharacterized membrane protein